MAPKGIKVKVKKGKRKGKLTKKEPKQMGSGVRCYMRYNNRGGAYRICSDMENTKNLKKPPSDIIPKEEQISASDFAQKHGGYTNLTNEQHKTYHRIYMREIRKDGGGNPELAQKITQAVKLVRDMNRNQTKLLKLQQKAERLDKKNKVKEYRKQVKALPIAMRTNKSSQQKIAKELGISDEDFDILNTKQNKEMVAQLEGNIKENKEVLDNINVNKSFTLNKPKPGEKFVIEF